MRRPRRHAATIRTPAVLPALGIALAAALAAACDTGPPDLGPADGAGLPPTDTGRVAVGDTAPDFTLRDRHGEPVTLSELRGRRIVLVFYRGHW